MDVSLLRNIVRSLFDEIELFVKRRECINIVKSPGTHAIHAMWRGLQHFITRLADGNVFSHGVCK